MKNMPAALLALYMMNETLTPENGCGGSWKNGCGGSWRNGCGGSWKNGCGGSW